MLCCAIIFLKKGTLQRTDISFSLSSRSGAGPEFDKGYSREFA